MAMTGILAKLENAVTSEEQDSVLRSFVTTLVNSTDDYDNVEVSIAAADWIGLGQQL